MELREKIFCQDQSLWIICLTDDYLQKKLSPLPDLVDWYNNQVFSKSLVAGKISLAYGAQTLVATSGLLPVSRILYFGLGPSKKLDTAKSQSLCQDLSNVVTALDERAPWVLLSAGCPEKFVDEFTKSRTSHDALALATIAVG